VFQATFGTVLFVEHEPYAHPAKRKGAEDRSVVGAAAMCWCDGPGVSAREITMLPPPRVDARASVLSDVRPVPRGGVRRARMRFRLPNTATLSS
jgi:hypothetical protein